MKRLITTLSIFLSLTAWLSIGSCNSADSDDISLEDSINIVKKASDLPLFELTGDVKQCTRTTYYKVELTPDGNIEIDTTAGYKPVILNFDKRHHYIKKEHETISRDSLGRIIRWADSTPNAKGVHGGFLRDTLSYNYENPYVTYIEGKGELTTVTRDSNGNIQSLTATPLTGVEGVTTASNVVLKTDDSGNWIERLTVWTVQSPGKKARVFYMLDKRDIIYY